jgi:adenosine kinase
LDISVVAPQSLFDKYSIKPATAVLAEEKDQPLFDEIKKFEKVGYVAGGATQNSIRGAEWMALTKGNTHYIGSIADDEDGKKLADVAAKDGVKTHYFYSKKHHTGRCAVLVKDKERSLIADLAAANDYSHDHFLSEEIQKLVKSVDIFYSAGFFLTVSPQTVVEVGKHALEHNKVLMINLSAPFIVQFFWDALNSVLPYADYVVCNEDEAATFAEKSGWAKEDLQGAAVALSKLSKLNDKRKRTVIFTQGKEPTIVAVDGEVTLYPVIPIDKDAIVDTNGAGDAFVAGLLAGLAADKPLAVAVAAGQYCANKVIQVEGAQYPATANDFKW